MVDRFLDWMAELPELATVGLLMLLSALENVFPPLPADAAVVLGALLAHRGGRSAAFLGLLCWVANTASAAGVYFYARRHGRSFFEGGWPEKLLPPSAMQALEEAYERHGVLGIFVSRFLPGVRAAVMPFAGVVGMSAWRALLPAATASAIWYGCLVAVGSFVGYNWDAAKGVIGDANKVLAVVSVLVTGAVGFWLWRRAKGHRARHAP